MKRIVSVSLGSSARDHEVEVELLGERFHIARRGTDGDFKKALALLAELDGAVDVIGLGGVDVYLCSRTKKYALRDGLKLMQAVKITPVVDGSGLKNTLEREVVRRLAGDGFRWKDRPVLLVSGMDRFGMAQAMVEAGARVVFGDLIFALGLDQPITSLDELEARADKLLPDLCKLPIGMLYPIGKKQDQASIDDEMRAKYYRDAEIVAGDYHFIRQYMPQDMGGKIILTNTVTAADVEDLRRRGAATLITTTPEFTGRSFGTNVLEATLLALLGKTWDEVTDQDYLDLIHRLDLKPRVLALQEQKADPGRRLTRPKSPWYTKH